MLVLMAKSWSRATSARRGWLCPTCATLLTQSSTLGLGTARGGGFGRVSDEQARWMKDLNPFV